MILNDRNKNSLEQGIQTAEKIAAAVSSVGGTAYYVGGCVRDKLLCRPFTDIDIEVHGVTADTLDKILSSFGHKHEYGASFGIRGLDGTNIDIAMPRLEQATGRGHRDFKTMIDPYIGVEKAAKRRDLTINAIMENVLTHELVDVYGGVRDLERGVIRHVSDASFSEDPLRVLRVAAFHARLGFSVSRDTLALCKSMDISELSRERVLAEAEKALLCSDSPSRFFEFLRECDKLEPWFAELKALIGVDQEPKYHAEGDAYIHTMCVLDEAAGLRERAELPTSFMLAALCHDLGKAATTELINGRIRAFGHESAGQELTEKLISRLTSDVKLKRYTSNMTLLHMRPNMLVAQNSSQKAYNKLFDAAVSPRDLLLLAKADHAGSQSEDKQPYGSIEEKLSDALAKYESIMARPYITGRDLVSCGISPGVKLGEALEFAHKLRLSGIERKDALAQVLAFARDELKS